MYEYRDDVWSAVMKAKQKVKNRANRIVNIVSYSVFEKDNDDNCRSFHPFLSWPFPSRLMQYVTISVLALLYLVS